MSRPFWLLPPLFALCVAAPARAEHPDDASMRAPGLTSALVADTRALALNPAGLAAHLQLYRAVMRGSRSLRKVERELIALVVSRVNDCHY